MHDQAALAIRNFLAYGKGRHQAQFNLADCFSYALAKSRGAPLLFKGDDFPRPTSRRHGGRSAAATAKSASG